MKEISIEGRSLRFLLFLVSILSQFISGFADNSSGPKNEKKASSSTGSKALIICVGIVVIAGLSFFLFKFWQRKRREEQYARLLKLFEEDDELELELGLRD